MLGLAIKALVDNRGTPRGCPDTGQARMRLAAQGKTRLRQRLLLGASRPNAKAGAHPTRVHRQQQLDACIPAQTVAPAAICQAGQPACATPLGSAGRPPGAVEGFIGTALGCQEADEIEQKCDQGCLLRADLPIVLLPRRQRRKGRPEMARCIAVKAALTAKALPRPAQGQGDHLTPAEGRLGTRVGLGGQGEPAKVIDHNVKSSQEGVHINPRSAPYLGEERAILSAGGTFRVSISCQLTPSVEVTL
jgi:hypothetical protein